MFAEPAATPVQRATLESLRFDGRAALVTGGGSGIGAACSRLLVERGARVLVADANLEAAEGVARALGDSAVPHRADVTDPEACEAMAAAAVAELGLLDLAVNSAGIGGGDAAIAEMSAAEWRQVLSVNLDGIFFCMRAEIAAMQARQRGAIVNLASTVGVVAMPNMAAYVAAKHGVVGLTRAGALECATGGIRINCVGPGVIETPLTAGATEDLAALHPMARLGTPVEAAELICFLLSDAASFCTGGWYPADAGWTAR